MKVPVRLFMLIETTAFGAAALTHFGVLTHGYEHLKAAIAESVIGAILLFGLVSSFVRSGSARRIGLAVQAFALFGTLVGLFTIAIGVGPETAPDISFHICILIVLVSGLIAARQKA